MLIREQIENLLADAAQSAQNSGQLPALSLPVAPVERPANPTHGDYASSLPLKLARAARASPLQIAKILVDHLPASPLLGNVTVAPPGFINFTLNDAWLTGEVQRIVQEGADFIHLDLGHGSRIQLEFVSANPTGPIPVAAGRGGSLGDSLARVLAIVGYHVEREYYVNDAGSRMDVFNQSVYARYRQQLGADAPVPADGYHGLYLVELAADLVREFGDLYLNTPSEEAIPLLGKIGTERFLDGIKADLTRLGIVYDCWFHEQWLFERGEVTRAIDLLRDRGTIAEREGAIWFASSALGEDKDNVLIRGNGLATYFASDIAYHFDKLGLRQFDDVIDIWGADHQGHVARTRAAVGALGINPDRLRIIIHQMVTVKRGDNVIRMSKRTGNIITLREVLDEVGPDACRFFFLSRSADSHMEFDLELAKRQSNENPVFYVQYAHARIASIIRYAAEREIDFADGDVTLLHHPAELALIRKMLELSDLIGIVAQTLEPHHLPHYALDLAAVFHSFYTECRVVTDDLDLTRARLKLVLAAKLVLGLALDLIGVSAPEEMARLEATAE